jgi:hypothetical protein
MAAPRKFLAGNKKPGGGVSIPKNITDLTNNALSVLTLALNLASILQYYTSLAGREFQLSYITARSGHISRELSST